MTFALWFLSLFLKILTQKQAITALLDHRQQLVSSRSPQATQHPDGASLHHKEVLGGMNSQEACFLMHGKPPATQSSLLAAP